MIHFSSRRSTYLCTALLAVLATACGGSDSPTDGGNGGSGNGGGGGGGPTVTTSVSVQDNFFTPEDIQVSPQATVTWTWAGSAEHNVTWTGSNTSGLTDSTTQSSGAFLATMPATSGTYAYFCTVHGLSMSGSVVVM